MAFIVQLHILHVYQCQPESLMNTQQLYVKRKDMFNLRKLEDQCGNIAFLYELFSQNLISNLKQHIHLLKSIFLEKNTSSAAQL